MPYAQRKSRRGRKKAVDTHGQACRRKSSARRHTALYRLKTPQARIAQVLQAVAEGPGTQAAARVFNLSEATVRRWLARAGLHSRSLHEHLMRSLRLTHVQLDELRLKLPGQIEAAWLWVAYDARTKLIPAFTLGPRTQAMAHRLLHEVAQRLAPAYLPVSLAPPARAGVSSDGLTLYFYALTAHFGAWVQARSERRRVWTVSAQLLYAQVIKRYRRRRVVEVRQHVSLGTPDAYREALRSVGFSGRIQTAFIERLHLTIRRSIAGLARRSWSSAHSLSELAWQFEWWRGYYHCARPHAGRRQVIGAASSPGRQPRYRQRTPAQAAGLTTSRWTVLMLISYPAPAAGWITSKPDARIARRPGLALPAAGLSEAARAHPQAVRNYPPPGNVPPQQSQGRVTRRRRRHELRPVPGDRTRVQPERSGEQIEVVPGTRPGGYNAPVN